MTNLLIFNGFLFGILAIVGIIFCSIERDDLFIKIFVPILVVSSLMTYIGFKTKSDTDDFKRSCERAGGMLLSSPVRQNIKADETYTISSQNGEVCIYDSVKELN